MDENISAESTSKQTYSKTEVHTNDCKDKMYWDNVSLEISEDKNKAYINFPKPPVEQGIKTVSLNVHPMNSTYDRNFGFRFHGISVQQLSLTQKVQEVDLQVHKHSKTCRKKGHPICRFGFPLPPFQKTIILEPLEIDVEKYKASSTIYAKGTPIHARGALLYNHHIKDKKLDNKYSLINNGEKIKFCYLKKPNWIHENVISFISDFPTELDLDKSIDYELQFEKAFLEPVKVILDAIGWNVEKVVNLELFFS